MQSNVTHAEWHNIRRVACICQHLSMSSKVAKQQCYAVAAADAVAADHGHLSDCVCVLVSDVAPC